MPLLGFSLAALIGLSLGLLGGGGSILTVPILVYVLGFGPKQSIAMGLAVVGTTSLVGAVSHGRAGNLQLRPALVFAALTMVGTWGGARLSVGLPGRVQLLLFATVMLVAALSMARPARGPSPAEEAVSPAAFPLVAASALGVGLLTGVVGVGGGFLIVPALVVLVGLPMRHAVGTSLAVIALNSFVGFAGHLGHVVIPWGALGVFTALAVAGILGGTWLSRFVSPGSLKRGFALLLGAVALVLLHQNRRVLTPEAPAPAAARSSATRE